MRRNGVWLLGAAVLAGPPLASPALADPPGPASPAAAIQRQGTLTVTGSYMVNKAIPNGTAVTISVSASVGDTAYSGSNQVSPAAKVAAGKVTFKVSLPYTWLLASSADKVTVTVDMSASPEGSAASYYYQNYDTKIIALPENGATTAVPFSGSL